MSDLLVLAVLQSGISGGAILEAVTQRHGTFPSASSVKMCRLVSQHWDAPCRGQRNCEDDFLS